LIRPKMDIQLAKTSAVRWPTSRWIGQKFCG
jgi:hypothetical protein